MVHGTLVAQRIALVRQYVVMESKSEHSPSPLGTKLISIKAW
jgi:hypothetical protein